MTKLYAECLRNHEKQTKSKERRFGEKRTSNEPTKEGRHSNEPKSKEEDVEIIVIEEEPESADITERSVESAIREKSISSDDLNKKAIENTKNGEISHARTKIESVRDKNKVALNCEEKSQIMTKEQFKDVKNDTCVESKKTCVRNSYKNNNEQFKDLKVQESADEQFKNSKLNKDALELSASDQIENSECEPYSICENKDSNLIPKINFLNKLNLITSTPISDNANKTYVIKKEVDIKQDLIESIRRYRPLTSE